MGTKPSLPFRLHTHRSGTIYVRWAGVDRSTGTKDPLEALTRAQEMWARRDECTFPAKAAIPLFPVAEAWLLTHNVDPATANIYKGYARLWDAFFHTLDAIPGKVDEYSYKRLDEVLRKTVRKELSALRMFTRWCVRTRRLLRPVEVPLPPREMKGVRVNEERKRTGTLLTVPQVQAVLAALPEHSERAPRFIVRDFFIVLYETGLRPATVERLRVGKHFREGALYIDEAVDKIRYERVLPVSPECLEALARAAAGKPEGAVIFGAHDFRGVLTEAATQAGLRGVTDYDFRHSRATHLLEAGGTLPGTAFLLGHRQVSTTARYAKPNERAAKETLERMI